MEICEACLFALNKQPLTLSFRIIELEYIVLKCHSFRIAHLSYVESLWTTTNLDRDKYGGIEKKWTLQECWLWMDRGKGWLRIYGITVTSEREYADAYSYVHLVVAIVHAHRVWRKHAKTAQTKTFHFFAPVNSTYLIPAAHKLLLSQERTTTLFLLPGELSCCIQLIRFSSHSFF